MTREEYYKGITSGKRMLDNIRAYEKIVNKVALSYTGFKLYGVNYYAIEHIELNAKNKKTFYIQDQLGRPVRSLVTSRGGVTIGLNTNVKNRKELIEKVTKLVNVNGYELMDSYFEDVVCGSIV